MKGFIPDTTFPTRRQKRERSLLAAPLWAWRSTYISGTAGTAPSDHHGKKRPRESNASSSSTTLNHLSSSRPLDDTIDENDDESFHSNSSSPSQNVSSSSNIVLRVRQNPPHESHNLNTNLSETINLKTQQRDDHWEGLRSIGQAFKNMMGGKQK
nr:hypothetical protein [Tanacetum cinerariifolium]